MSIYRIYCDESCHLEHDKSTAMGLGAIWVPDTKIKEINNRIKEIKAKHKINHELKWSRLQPAKYSVYEDVVNYFFDDDDIAFRGVIIDKTALDHARYFQTHEDFYYKMYYYLLIYLMKTNNNYKIFIDIKDTKHKDKIEKLDDCITNKNNKISEFELPKRILHNIQVIRSNEVEIMQLVDIILGAVVSHCRKININEAKQKIINLIIRKTGYSLTEKTLPSEVKFNLLHFPNGKLGD